MKYISLLLSSVLSLSSALISAQSLTDNVTTEMGIVAPYLKDLEEEGYCVIPNVLSTSEAEALCARVWHEFIEKAWPHCKMEDRSNWKEAFPMHNKMGIFAGPAGQTQVMWDLRQDPRIVDVFAKVWNTHDLIVSMDGLCFMCPTAIREGNIEPWPHVDQAVLINLSNVTHSNMPPPGFVSESALKTQPYTIQGQFLFEDSSEGDGGFYCIPRSHLRFLEIAPRIDEIYAMEIPRAEKRRQRIEFLNGLRDEAGKSYERKHVIAPKGSLILWDSRTVHWNQHSARNDNPKVRMVGYLSYVPKARMNEETRELRREAFEKGVSTGHNPVNPEHKFTKDHIAPEFVQYLEDPNYVQPEIQLTPLGKSLLGL